MNRIDPATAAAELHALADAIAAGTAPLPAMRRDEVDGYRMRIVPRIIHDVLCTWRIATPQETDPVVLGCAGCGLCYPPASVDPTGMTTGMPVDPAMHDLVKEIKATHAQLAKAARREA
ncbi:hypothetical protein ABZ671_18710 [Micromonospora sp. NPDC006766]|uniref:hypothetical protein n=1 Tax=Micromonospora sp. NPDC006766 TaxID=3154778 RepID=UPI0033E753D4